MENRIEELMKEIRELKRVRADVRSNAIAAQECDEWGIKGDSRIIIDALTYKIDAVTMMLHKAEHEDHIAKYGDEDLSATFFDN